MPRGLRQESGARRVRRALSSARHGHAPGGTRPEVMPRTTGDYSPHGLTQALLTGIFPVENTTEIEPERITTLIDYALMPSALNAPPWAPTSSRSITHPRRERRCAAALRRAVQAQVAGRTPAQAHAGRERRE